jgi:hypothetical protein
MCDQEDASSPVPAAETPQSAPDRISDAVDNANSHTATGHSGVEDIIFSTRTRTKPIRGF